MTEVNFSFKNPENISHKTLGIKLFNPELITEKYLT